jgi:hypothetical protein
MIAQLVFQLIYAFFAPLNIFCLYKIVTILYLVCFFCYVLFSRVPDYFEGEYVNGIVSKATFSVKDKQPVLAVKYKVGKEEFEYVTNKWFLSPHKQGQLVTMIYNPSDPAIASIYAFIGYWITLKELFFTAVVFIILFIAAVMITGGSPSPVSANDEENKKRKYDD